MNRLVDVNLATQFITKESKFDYKQSYPLFQSKWDNYPDVFIEGSAKLILSFLDSAEKLVK